MSAAEKFEAALLRLVNADPVLALQLVTGSFVGLVMSTVSANGHDTKGEIFIDGGMSRDITIHAPKAPEPT